MMIKKILLGTISVVVIVGLTSFIYLKDAFKAPANSCKANGEAFELPLAWAASKTSDRAAMLVPVNVEGVPDTLYMQFDLGAIYSILYYKPLSSLKDKYPDFNQGLNKDFNIKLGELNVSYDSIKLINYGKSIENIKPGERIIIGTIGTDLLERVNTLIDFKNSRISFMNKAPDYISSRQKVPFEFKERRIYLEAKIANEKRKLMWDTGSSSYSLITSKEYFHQWRDPNQRILEEDTNQKKRKLKAYTAPTEIDLELGDRQMTIPSVTYIEGFPWYIEAMFGLSGMQGMLGNNLFRNEKIYLDCANEQMVLL